MPNSLHGRHPSDSPPHPGPERTYDQARAALARRSGQEPSPDGRGLRLNFAEAGQLMALGLSHAQVVALLISRPFASWADVERAGFTPGQVAALQATGAHIE